MVFIFAFQLLRMGPKKKGQAKFTRPTLDNPLIVAKSHEASKELAEEIKAAICDRLKGLFPPAVTKALARESLKTEKEADVSDAKLKAKDYRAEVNQRRKELRQCEGLDLESRKFVRTGLKQCLKGLAANYFFLFL